MVSISKPEAIALILNYIKNPVKPTLKTFAEGKLISVKAIGMPGIASLSSLSSLSSLTTVAGLASAANLLGSVPGLSQVSGLMGKLPGGLSISGLTGSLGSLTSLTGMSTLTSQFGVGGMLGSVSGALGGFTDKLGGLTGGLSGAGFSGILSSLSNISGASINLGSLSSSLGLPNLSSLSDLSKITSSFDIGHLTSALTNGSLKIPGIDAANFGDLAKNLTSGPLSEFQSMTKQISEGTLNIPGLGNVGDVAGVIADARGGIGSLLSNPIATSVGNITAAVTNLPTQLSSLVSAGKITSGNAAAIIAALPNLTSAASAIKSHTDVLSGLVEPVNSNQYHLDTVLSMTDSLTSTVGHSDDIPSIVTSLTSATTVDSIHTDLTSIYDTLHLSGDSAVAGVLSAISAHATTLNNYVSSDVAAYQNINNQINTESVISNILDKSQSADPNVQAILQLVVQPDKLAIILPSA